MKAVLIIKRDGEVLEAKTKKAFTLSERNELKRESLILESIKRRDARRKKQYEEEHLKDLNRLDESDGIFNYIVMAAWSSAAVLFLVYWLFG